MSKSVKPNKINSQRIARQASRKNKITVVNGKIVRKNSIDGKILKARSDLKRTGAMKQHSRETTGSEINGDCLLAMGVKVRRNNQTNKSLLSEEESSDKLRNTNIVDVQATKKLKKQKIETTDKFPDIDDPWNQNDVDRPNYRKTKQEALTNKDKPKRDIILAAVYTVHTSEFGKRKGSRFKRNN